MQTVARSNFTTVKTEGAILPADLLQRIADGDLDGLRPEDYHLAPTEKPNEAINRAWNRCLGVWQSFNQQRQNLPATDTGTSLTRERWLLILFQELGYGRLPFQRRIDLDDGTSYPISHLWEQSPIHLISFRQELDKRDPTIKRSPHSLMQEFLNRSDDHLWGFVSNGLTLRVLRDNISLTRAAYLEFDLETMMTGELYADFSLLWLVCHQSRIEIGTQPDAPALPSNCWLESWSQSAAEQGTRALDALRDGVQETIAALGRGFLAHRANSELNRQLSNGELSTQDYYRQLLRLVYRLIFLFVAEDRDLLLLPDSEPQTRQRYAGYYSISRLRRLAETRRGGPHPDLYRTLRRIFFLLRQGYEPLGLPALGSFLFSERSTPALDEADIANNDLLNAIRALAFTIEGRVRRPVDYKNLGSEELGSVYESLLELHPQLNIAAAGFELATAAGSERKTTGSYYTPSSLINSLLDSALEPVVEDRLKGKTNPAEAEKALLNIKVVDPACGSGHFLIAAGNRLAAHLARIRTGDDEPSPAARREALRDVVRHCIHGVDINEMSVELCKVALWMETLDPGKPLGFLDRNIQCGNSLIGATPALLKKGIPDEAFKPITGDDKAYCSEWKKQNKKQRGQKVMDLDPQPWDRLGDLAAAMTALDRLGSDTLAEVQAQESSYEKLVRSTPYEYSQFWADAWCAAFVWPKKPEYDGGYAYPITEDAFRKIERNPHDVAPWMREEVEHLRNQYQFFHWHLAFPHVFSVPPVGEGTDNEQTGWNGGFDVVLGNPPWEQLQLNLREFFAVSAPNIAKASHMSERKKLIKQLATTNSELFDSYLEEKQKSDREQLFVHESNIFPRASYGRLNSAPLFVELCLHIQAVDGRIGIIVPTGVVTDTFSQYLFQHIMETKSLVSLHSFENEELIFPAVHHATRFSLMTLTGTAKAINQANFVFFARRISHLLEEYRCFSLSSSDIKLINPNTRTCPNFRSNQDAEITKSIHRRVPIVSKLPAQGQVLARAWPALTSAGSSQHYRSLDDLIKTGGHLMQGRIIRTEEVSFLPLIEAKQIHQFDPCFATYEGVSDNDRHRGKPQTIEKNPNQIINLPLPRFWAEAPVVEKMFLTKDWIREWIIGIRDVTAATNERTAIACILPRVGLIQPLNGISVDNPLSALWILGAINSFSFDYVARQKTPSTHLNVTIFSQLPIPMPNNDSHSFRIIIRSVLELSYCVPSLSQFAADCGYHGPPFRWDEERRFLIRCELDAAYFHLYGIERDDVAYIMETFPIVKRKDEKAHSEYRTKRVILEIYDEMAVAMRIGQPYQTRLDPPPADPRVAHPWDPAFGPEPEQLWVETPDDERRTTHSTSSGQADETATTIAETPTPYSVERKTFALPTPEPSTPTPQSEPLLRNPVAEIKKPKKPKPAQVAQGTFMEVMPAPAGPYNVRLKRVMALGSDPSPLATRELIAFLADENSNIRWLAGSSLVQRVGTSEDGGADTVAAIAAFLTQAGPERVEQAKPEALRVLGLIVETVEDESVQVAAREIIERG